MTVVDDYGHHPAEVRATLRGAREAYGRRVVCVFQPHRYTRTRDLLEEFATAFNDADVLLVTDVYAAGEEPIPGISGGALADGIRACGHRDVTHVPRAGLAAAARGAGPARRRRHHARRRRRHRGRPRAARACWGVRDRGAPTGAARLGGRVAGRVRGECQAGAPLAPRTTCAWAGRPTCSSAPPIRPTWPLLLRACDALGVPGARARGRGEPARRRRAASAGVVFRLPVDFGEERGRASGSVLSAGAPGRPGSCSAPAPASPAASSPPASPAPSAARW